MFANNTNLLHIDTTQKPYFGLYLRFNVAMGGCGDGGLWRWGVVAMGGCKHIDKNNQSTKVINDSLVFFVLSLRVVSLVSLR